MTFLPNPTPGPWKVHFYRPFQIVRADNEHVIIANAVDDNQAANARLIAAAPELLDACKLAMEEAKQMHDHFYPRCKYQDGCPSQDVYDRLTAVIGKAEGRET